MGLIRIAGTYFREYGCFMQLSGSRADEAVDSLIAIFRTIKRHVDPQLEQGQHTILRALQLEPGRRATELAELCALAPSTVSRHLRQLETDGRVRREADPADGRAHLLHLTEAGDEVARQALHRRRHLILDQLANWNPDEVEDLAHLLKRLHHDIDPSENKIDPSENQEDRP